MQKLVIDTNVLVSALIRESYPHRIVFDIFPDKNIIWCISDEVFGEYDSVLNRTKFSKYSGFTIKAERLLAFVEAIAAKFTPQITLKVIKDLSDNKFLELASTCEADFLITGNTLDFTMSTYGQTKIVTPKEYWEKYR